ncbi:MAG: aldo/keto reductase [Pseudomonadota bacterium]
MERISLTPSLRLSRLVYGMWRLGDDTDRSPNHVQAKIEACLEQGLTTMDQADIYGDYGAEEILGNCLRSAPQLREKIEIVTKCDIIAPIGRHSNARVKYYDTSRAHIEASVEQSLRLMNIDQIDLLLIHRPDPFMDHVETGSTLDDLIKSGKVKAVGVSNFRPWDWRLLQSAMESKLATNQIEMSVVAHDAFTNGDLAFLQEHGVSPMAWSPLGGGAIFGKGYPSITSKLSEVAERYEVDSAAIAIAWLLAHPAKIIPVLGTNKLTRISELSHALRVKMDRQTWFEIYTAALGEEVA